MKREEAETLAGEMCEECKFRCEEGDRNKCDGFRKEVDEILKQEKDVEAEAKRFLTAGKGCKQCGFKTAQTEKYQGYCFQCACEKGIAQNPFDK